MNKPLLILALMLSGTAQAERPPAGAEVDQIQSVGLLQKSGRPCVSIALEGATVTLSSRELEKLAAPRKTEEEREGDDVRRRRAARLLNELPNLPKGKDGCLALDRDRLRDGEYLLADLLEKGRVLVRRPEGRQPEARIRVRYQSHVCGDHCGRGDIRFLLEDSDTPFFGIIWWIS